MDEARIAGYAWALKGGMADDSYAAFAAWAADSDRAGDGDDIALFEAWSAGVLDCTPPLSTAMLTPDDVAALKCVTTQTVYLILRNPSRRKAIFPSARCRGEGRRRTWLIALDEAERWQPVRGRGRKATRQRLDVE